MEDDTKWWEILVSPLAWFMYWKHSGKCMVLIILATVFYLGRLSK